MTETVETIIVGGGMAGMTCALKLQDEGRPYLMITENMGGRICYRKEHNMNFGAVFFMKGYHHAKNILAADKPVLPSYFALECHRELGRGYGVLSGPMLGALPSLIRFLWFMSRHFRPNYEQFKKDCESMEMREAMEKTPFIKELFERSATDFLKERKFDKAAKVLSSQFVYACTGSPIETLNALDYCNCAMGLIDTPMRFYFDADGMQEHLSSGGGAVEFDTVTAIQRLTPDDVTAATTKDAARWEVETAQGKRYTARNLVVATPTYITQKLLEEISPLGPIREASVLYAYKVQGDLKEEYTHHELHLFDEQCPITNMGARDDGAYELFTCEQVDLGMFFNSYEELARVDWPHALYTHPSILIDQKREEGLYLCGDHNALGLEPTAISGIYAAKLVMEQ